MSVRLPFGEGLNNESPHAPTSFLLGDCRFRTPTRLLRSRHAGPVKKGAKSSDPRLTGPRDMNYDHTIVPGVRIGPVRLAGLVSDAVQHLGNPDKVWRIRLPNSSSDEVYYWYKDECISFSWQDQGIDPTIDSVDWARFAIEVWCNKWSTPDGIQVGTSMSDLSRHLGVIIVQVMGISPTAIP